jgi:hypothetical protein
MFQAVQLPTGITDLNTGLANVDRNTFTHFAVFLAKGGCSKCVCVCV